MRLADVCDVIRSKNAGPYELTFDLLFHARETYQKIKAARAIDADLAARLYRVSAGDVLGVHYFDSAAAIKITIRRPRAAGDPGETDVYGAQQHAPWLGLEIDPDVESS